MPETHGMKKYWDVCWWITKTIGLTGKLHMGIHGDGLTFETSLKQLVYRNSRYKHLVMIFSSKMRSSTLVIILIFVTRKKRRAIVTTNAWAWNCSYARMVELTNLICNFKNNGSLYRLQLNRPKDLTLNW